MSVSPLLARLYLHFSEAYSALRSGVYRRREANLYKRGVDEGRRGELIDASELLELLDVFGEDGVRSYLVGYLEGVDDAMEEEDE
jgi:hypothetical protein